MLVRKAKKAQVTLFIIIAIIIVAAVVFTIFYFSYFKRSPVLSSEIQPVESYFQECIDGKIKEAAKIAALQGGYLELPDFEPGSEYIPFSNQLDFLGMQIPFWFYVSGNNIAKEQKPALEEIEKQFEDYIIKTAGECDFSSFTEKGYLVEFTGELNADVKIKKATIDVVINWPLIITFGDISSRITKHKINAKSNFGRLYDTASTIFKTQQEKIFLEDYTLDVLRLYAPVTGIEISCAPKLWIKEEVKTQIQEALEGNIAAIKVSGSYYKIEPEHQYFVVDTGKNIEEQVYFLYNKNMPIKFEVWPSDDIMKADPIGMQPGLNVLGALGLCYVPYHFIYDLNFPVLVQVIKGEEIFQFPVLVIIDKNTARNATTAESTPVIFDICQYKTQEVVFFTYDENSMPIEAEIAFKCFNQICPIGRTIMQEGKASLTAPVPQCYNGFLIAKAPGYVDAKKQVGSIGLSAANLFLRPSHILDIDMGLASDEYATITFTSQDSSTSIYWPEQKQITLSEGIYDISANVFKESEIILESQKGEKCIKMPAGGIAGMFGAMREECFELEIPSETLTKVLFGGGKTSFAVTETELSQASKLEIKAPLFDMPKNMLELADIYSFIDVSELQIELI